MNVSNCLPYLGKSLMKEEICSLMIGTTFPIAKAMRPNNDTYNSKMESTLFLTYRSKSLTTGLKIKNRNPAMIIGKNRVEKNTPIGSNKNVSFVAMYIIVSIISICNDQLFNLPLDKWFHLFCLIYFVKLSLICAK